MRITTAIDEVLSDRSIGSYPAIYYDGMVMDYNTLSIHVNQLAAYLSKLYKNKPIGFCLKRGFHNIVVMLAIMKSRNFYVPLDKSYPADRLNHIIRDTALEVIITDYDDDEYNTYSKPINVVRLSTRVTSNGFDLSIRGSMETIQDAGSIQDNNHNDLAYIIYTSGTTGMPKGVMIKQVSLLNLIQSAIRILRITPRSNIFQYASIGFDAAGWDIYIALLSRSTIYMATSAMMVDPPNCHAYILKHGINMATVTPAFLAQMPLERIPSLRTLIVMGDMADSKNMEFWCNNEDCAIPAKDMIEVYNGYGPTETTIGATLHKYMPGDSASNIGTPFHNYDIYVMDDNMQIVQDGQTGEICIGGISLAAGYWNRPDITKAKFVDTSYGRLYRTGDLAFKNSMGEFNIVGRIDNQIKINGIRVELEDIESTAMQIPEISRACATYNKDTRRLVLYYTLNAGSQVEQDFSSIIKAHLGSYLHRAVVPQHYMCLTNFVLTVNGKVSRKDLPPFEESEKIVTPPSTDTEKKVVLAYSEFAPEHNIGRETDFLEIGGDSLRSNIVCKALLKLGIRITAIDVLQHIVVSDLAAFIDTLETEHVDDADADVDVQTDGLLLTPIQQNLLSHQIIYPADPSYNTLTVFELKSMIDLDLDVQRLIDAIRYVVYKHEALRTRLEDDLDCGISGKVLQFFDSTILINVVEMSRDEISKEIMQDVERPFDMFDGSLVRIRLFKNANTHILMFVKHNIVADAWSEGVICRDLTYAYNSKLSAQYVQDNADTSYAKYVSSVRSKFGPKVLAYWESKLANYIPLNLPKSNKPSQNTNRSERFTIRVPGFEAFTKDNRITPFNALLAALTIVLSRYTNTDPENSDISLGTQIADRGDDRWSNTVGFMVYTVVLRNLFNYTTSVADFVQTVRDTLYAAMSNKYITFTDLSRICGSKIDIMFVMQNAKSQDAPQLDNMTVTPITIDLNSSAFPLYIDAYAGSDADTYNMHVRYDTSFEPSLISNMMRSFEIVLNSMVENFYAPISTIEYIKSPKILVGPIVTHENGLTLDRVISKHTMMGAAIRHSTGDADGLNDVMTYAELDANTNRIAQCLISKYGVIPSSVVGLQMRRSINFVSMVIGIWKAGASYVPIDPDFPTTRIDYMKNDCTPKLVVCTETQDRVDSLPTVRFDELHAEAANYEPIHVSRSTPDSLAYIVYTSGSTGNPKGCMITHSAVLNVLNYFRAELEIMKTDKVWSMTTVSFDIMVLENFLPLVSGAELLICPQCVSSNPVALVNWINKEMPTVVQATPTMFSMIGPHIKPNNKMRILVGGEAVPTKVITMLLSITPNVYNVYGPSETTIWSTIKKIRDSTDSSIGKPISNTTCVVLNTLNQPVPVSCVGELCIGGDGLAVGYYNKPDLTSAKFVQYDGMRVYKTGDLVKINPDTDDIEYVGRSDFQLKIRGHRIELGEIVCALESHHSVKRAVVITKVVTKDDGDQHILVAYYCGVEDGSIIEHIRSKLPKYMVPSYVIWLPRFPETLNGKVDLKQLPDPFGSTLLTFVKPANHVEPRNKVEQILHDMFVELIRCDSISVTDSLLNVGASSILFEQMVGAINKEFDICITVVDLIQHFSIEECARLCAEMAGLDLNDPSGV